MLRGTQKEFKKKILVIMRCLRQLSIDHVQLPLARALDHIVPKKRIFTAACLGVRRNLVQGGDLDNGREFFKFFNGFYQFAITKLTFLN